MKPLSTATLLRARLDELNPRDTFELGMYRLLAWAETDGTDRPSHDSRLADWAAILGDLSARLGQAASR